jgi:hypothetical protein
MANTLIQARHAAGGARAATLDKVVLAGNRSEAGRGQA